MKVPVSKVYVLVDEKSRITRIDGGYTLSNIENIDDWVLIDNGVGTKYNLCQHNYFDHPIIDERGVYRYKLVDGVPIERTKDEMDADYIERIPSSVKHDRIQELEEKNDALEEQLIETQLALCDSYEYQLMVEEQLTDTQLALCDLYELIESLLGGV